MKAVQFQLSLPRYGLSKVAGLISGRAFHGAASCLSLNEVPEPEIIGPRWVKLRSVLSGFCGSDLGIITLKNHPSAQPFSSFPLTLGHENFSIVEEVGAEVTGVRTGDRVLLDPHLCCEVRGIDPVCRSCARGEKCRCQNFAEGEISPGLITGACADTGGGWAEYYLAHESQLYRVPPTWTPEAAVMVEPLCGPLNHVMRARPGDGETVMVYGCGVMGLGVIAAIRALRIRCHITAVEVAELNIEKARELGADEVIVPHRESLFERAEKITGAKRYKPQFAGEICMGGFNKIFDTLGSTATINQSLRLAAGGGTFVLVGIQMPWAVDWTPVWLKGLNITGGQGCGTAEYRGARQYIFDIAMELVDTGKVDLTSMITHRFSLDEYRRAIEVNQAKASHGAIKTVFEVSA
jgi:threonine dehydrogenase-like Zn-dependent dehydrogenase